MTETQVNIPLLRKAVEWAEAEAAKPFELCEWNQEMWVTSLTSEQADQWGYSGVRSSHQEMHKAPECGTCYCIAGYTVASVDGPRPIVIEDRAQELLGLSLQERARLFAASNTISDVRRIAEDIAGERL